MPSFQSCYGIGLVAGFFCRRFFSPVLIFFIWWYWAYHGFADSPDGADYRYLQPLAMMTGTFIGYAVSATVNLKRLLFWKQFQLFGCWMLIAAIEFSLLIGALLIADYETTFSLPLNYFLTLILYVVVLVLFFFGTYKMTVWKTRVGGDFTTNDRAAIYFYILLGIFGVSSILLFLVVGWAAPAASQRWTWLGTVGLHVGLYSLLWRLVVSATIDAAESPNARATREFAERKGAEIIGHAFTTPAYVKVRQQHTSHLLPPPPPSAAGGAAADDDMEMLMIRQPPPPSKRDAV